MTSVSYTVKLVFTSEVNIDPSDGTMSSLSVVKFIIVLK